MNPWSNPTKLSPSSQRIGLMLTHTLDQFQLIKQKCVDVFRISFVVLFESLAKHILKHRNQICVPIVLINIEVIMKYA